MEVVIDGRTGLAAARAGATFRDILEMVRREVEGRRRIVVSLTLDGEVLSRERKEALLDQVAAGDALLEVRTADPYRLAVETLSGLQGHLANVDRALGAAAELFKGGEYSRTLDKLEESFHGWEILIRAVRDVGLLSSADFFRISTEGDSIDWCIRRLQAALLRFETALETKDVPRLNDIASEELRPQVAKWRGVVAALGEFVAKASGSSP